jgi:hypothetical protein
VHTNIKKDNKMAEQIISTKTEQENMRDFVNELSALYAKRGYQVAGQLVWVNINHTTYGAAVAT